MGVLNKQQEPLFAFGHGLSYTTFDYTNFIIENKKDLKIIFTVKNTGKRSGAAVPQVYLMEVSGKPKTRLIAFERVDLLPGESKTLRLKVEPRLLADYNEAKKQWTIPEGNYKFGLGKSVTDIVELQSLKLNKIILNTK